MRALSMGVVVIGACTSGGHDAPVRVEIPLPLNSLSSETVTFEGPDGARIMETTEAGWWVAPVPSGGSIDVLARDGSSPSSIGHSEWTMTDVQPGDVFSLHAGTLPADCRCRVMTVTSDDLGNFSWTDPEAAPVSARLVTVVNPFLGMGVDFGTRTSVDHDTASSVHLVIDPLQELQVRVVSCASSGWDDIRTKLGVASPDCGSLSGT